MDIITTVMKRATDPTIADIPLPPQPIAKVQLPENIQRLAEMDAATRRPVTLGQLYDTVNAQIVGRAHAVYSISMAPIERRISIVLLGGADESDAFAILASLGVHEIKTDGPYGPHDEHYCDVYGTSENLGIELRFQVVKRVSVNA